LYIYLFLSYFSSQRVCLLIAYLVDEDSPAVEAYKKHMSTFISPLIETCNALAKEDPKMKDIGTSILNAWEGIGTIVALASKCKKPSGAQQNFQQALMPYLKQTQVRAVPQIQLYSICVYSIGFFILNFPLGRHQWCTEGSSLT